MVFLRYSVLALRILVWVLLASLLVFGLASGFGLVHERGKALQAAHLAAEDAVGYRLSAISNSLWQYDIAGMDTLLWGMVQSGSIVQVEVLDHDKPIASARKPGSDLQSDRV